MRVDGADLPEAAGLDRQTVSQLTTALVKGQQADAIAVGRADEPSIRAEAQLLNVAPPHIGLLYVVGEAEGAARGDKGTSWCSLLELIHTRPLEGEKEKDTDEHVKSSQRYTRHLKVLIMFVSSLEKHLTVVQESQSHQTIIGRAAVKANTK